MEYLERGSSLYGQEKGGVRCACWKDKNGGQAVKGRPPSLRRM